LITNFLSTVTGQFTRQWILGHFIPAVLFVIFGLLFLVPLFPPDWPVLRPLETLGTEWKIIIIAFVTILLTALLYNLNVIILRLYTGHYWKEVWSGKYFTKRNRVRFDVAHAQRQGSQALLEQPQESGDSEAAISTIAEQQSRAARMVNREFPSTRHLVLPTRLGNVIRSFEEYPNRQYGIDAPTLWPRMLGKLDKDYGVAVADSKTSFDFTLNSSFLSAIMAMSILAVGLYFPVQLASPDVSARLDILARWGAEIILFVLAASLLYVSSIQRAKDWGDMYKGAFDLYRRDLLKQLGYAQVPETVAEEISLWDTISRQMIYGYPPPQIREPLPYTAARTSASGDPFDVTLSVTRGAAIVGSTGAIKISVRVENPDEERAVERVTIMDVLPEKFEYLWNSAHVTGVDDPIVTGTNPYEFYVGRLVPLEHKIFRSRLCPPQPATRGRHLPRTLSYGLSTEMRIRPQLSLPWRSANSQL
jgi:hypothetical protein